MVPPVILWWVWVTFVAACVVDLLVQGVTSPRFGAVVSAILLLVTGLMYTLALRPQVVIGERELTVRNPFRSHHIPWPVIHARWVPSKSGTVTMSPWERYQLMRSSSSSASC